MIEIDDVSHIYDVANRANGFTALSHVSAAIEQGTITAFLGPSGCGKTTLLRIIDGLVKPSHGAVRIDGRVVTGPAADRTMVFQEFNLLPWRTALGNVAFPLQVAGTRAAERRRKAREALSFVNLGAFADYYPHQLSGGMKQRVGIARALVGSPSFLLMDEPFGALDPLVREMMQVELLKILETRPITVLFVTHSIEESILLSDRVLVFGANPGRIICDLEIDIARPRSADNEAIRASPRFAAYRQQIWSVLKPQLSAAA